MYKNDKEAKRYYWLKLKNTYFSQLTQKKMRREENGKEMQVIYLRMMLLSIDNKGFIYYQGLYDSLEEELALEFDEDVELIRQTIEFLKRNNLVTIDEEENCYLPEAVENTGSESYSAERMRRMRAKKSQCDTDVTKSDTTVTASDEEIEIELEKELEIEREGENSPPLQCNTDVTPKKKKGTSPRFTPPTVEEVKAYCAERNNGVDAQRFVDFYACKGWMVGKNKMKDWRAAVRTWEQRDKKEVSADDTAVEVDAWAEYNAAYGHLQGNGEG